MKQTGRVLFAGAVFAVVATVGAAAFAIEQMVYRSHQAAEKCARQVAERVEDRLMWEWLTAQFPDSDVARDAAAQLELRLPLLRCVDNIAIPIDEENPA